jgi:glutamyl-tRNA reductase
VTGVQTCALPISDILICATSAPHTIIKKEDIPAGKEMLIFDLAFPRDVAPELAREKGIRLFDLENIEQFAQKNLSLRNGEIQEAEQIIEEEINKFQEWHHFRKLRYAEELI